MSFYGHESCTNAKCKTASGEVFNENHLTMASFDFPFGTCVQATSHSTGKSVVVRVNDTGGFRRYGRIGDMSKAAARALGFVAKGTDTVTLQRVAKRC